MSYFTLEANMLRSGIIALQHPKDGGFYLDIEDFKNLGKIPPELGKPSEIEFTEEQYKQARDIAEESRRLID